jgi:mannose/fructose/N-acetylgalactosamine-specific phosphotransferase system component IIB
VADVSLVRVDNRLIHGQVATGFMNQCSAAKIVVIDDRAASNELSKDALELATPGGIELSVFTAAQALEAWKAARFGSKSPVMVIFKTISIAFELYQAGFKYAALQIGGTNTVAGRKKIEGAISLDGQEAKMLNTISESGVEITFQQTVQTKISQWKDVKKKLDFG